MAEKANVRSFCQEQWRTIPGVVDLLFKSALLSQVVKKAIRLQTQQNRMETEILATRPGRDRAALPGHDDYIFLLNPAAQ